MTIRILVVDTERAFADALATRLAAEPDVASATVATPAALGRGWVDDPRVDVVLLDADAATTGVAGVAAALAARPGAPRVVMLSATSEPERIVAAVRAGAAAWVRKDESVTHLLQVVRGVVRGETWLSPADTGGVLRLLLAERDRRRDGDRMLAELTPREREVLAYLAQGVGRSEVARRLHLSAHTVRTHLQNLMAKLDVHSAVEAVAVTRHLLDDPIDGRPPVVASDRSG